VVPLRSGSETRGGLRLPRPSLCCADTALGLCLHSKGRRGRIILKTDRFIRQLCPMRVRIIIHPDDYTVLNCQTQKMNHASKFLCTCQEVRDLLLYRRPKRKAAAIESNLINSRSLSLSLQPSSWSRFAVSCSPVLTPATNSRKSVPLYISYIKPLYSSHCIEDLQI
jgi:hypothetical protein